MLSFDTETTGVDFHHGTRPFFVSLCRDDGTQTWFEWDVDPVTREVKVPTDDVAEIARLLIQDPAEPLVLQNAKFDFQALGTVGLWEHVDPGELWRRVDDTLLAGHLLASNQPHDLTSMVLLYLDEDIQHYEDELEKAVKEAHKVARRDYKTWRIARKDDPMMPSAKEKTWKSDVWLPRYVAELEDYPANHLWRTVTRDYANADTSYTLALWLVMEKVLRRRKLWDIYQARRRVLPVVYQMETHGVTVSRPKLEQLRREYQAESERCAATCLGVARGLAYDLELPKTSNNNSLRQFCFGPLALPAIKRSQKTGEPSLDVACLEHYEAVLEEGPALDFITALRAKRSRDTALSYMESYERFWIPMTRDDRGRPIPPRQWYKLYPSLNPTGTDTLRFSSANPNEQNISKKKGFNLRLCFGPAPGREWWSMDAKNIELRLPAYDAGEQELIDLFERSDEPPYYGSNHLLNFHTVYPDIWEAELAEVGLERVGPHIKEKYESTWYKWCKNGGFAVQYGAVERGDGEGTADRAFRRRGSHAKLKERFARLEQLNRRCIAMAERLGWVETIPDRTVDPKRGYPLLCSRSEWGKIIPTVPLNYRTQGSAMWWMGKAMVRCQAKLDEWRRRTRFDGRIVMQVHDELVFDFPRSRVDPLSKKPEVSRLKTPTLAMNDGTNLWRVRVLQRLMEQGGDDYGIPTPVSVNYHPESWAVGHTF